MARRKKREQEEKGAGIRLSLKEYQKAIGRAGDPDVAEKISKIYTTSEQIRTSKAAQGLAKQASKGFVGTGVSSSKRAAGEKSFAAIARKAISLVSPGGSAVKAVTSSGSAKGSRGRGRPSGTYKVRYLPSGRAVKVPTHIYKKMLSAEKSQIRLMRAQQLAQTQMQADQVAMQTDARYQPGSEEQFLAEPDQAHEMEVARVQQQAEFAQMQQEVPQGSGVGRRIVKGFGDFGRGLSRLGGAKSPQQFDQFGRPLEQPQQQFQRTPAFEARPREPKLTIISEKSSLLTAPNEWNNPGQSTILWNKRRRLNK